MRAFYQDRSARAMRPQRSGFAIIGVMACLVIVSLLVVSWLKTVTFERQQARIAEQRLQAEWLAEAALDRAAARLFENPGYAGERWKIPAEDLAARDAAAVEIHVTAVADHPDRREIRVVADHPVDPIRRVRVSKEFIVNLGKSGAESGAAKTNSSKAESGK